MAITRRQFIACAAGAAAWSVRGRSPAASVYAGEQKPVPMQSAIPIVDTHQHLWDLAKLKLPWLKGDTPIHRSFVIKDYLEATRGLGVVKSVYMEVDVDPADHGAEAAYVLDLCGQAKWPTCAAVLGARPGADGFRQYITRFKGSPYVKGVRQILPGPGPESQKRFFLEKPFLDGIRLLGELGMSFDVCIPPAGLPEAANLVGLCPDTRFILDHCGNADVKMIMVAQRPGASEQAQAARRYVDQWRRGIGQLAGHKNLVCKISGIIASVPKGNWGPDALAPIINHCLDSFGPDRVMFASDWPVCTLGAPLRDWVGALREIVRARSQSEQRKLWGENALRFYGLGR
jgi:predicted TIM-barrel fold metal-dependent hydrolase